MVQIRSPGAVRAPRRRLVTVAAQASFTGFERRYRLQPVIFQVGRAGQVEKVESLGLFRKTENAFSNLDVFGCDWRNTECIAIEARGRHERDLRPQQRRSQEGKQCAGLPCARINTWTQSSCPMVAPRTLQALRPRELARQRARRASWRWASTPHVSSACREQPARALQLQDDWPDQYRRPRSPEKSRHQPRKLRGV